MANENVGTMQARLTLNIRDFSKNLDVAIQKAKQLGNLLNSALGGSQGFSSMIKEAMEAKSAMEQLTAEFKSFQAVSNGSTKATEMFRSIQDHTSKARQQVQNLNKELSKTSSAPKATAPTSIEDINRQFAQASREVKKVGPSIDDINKQFAMASVEAKKVTKSVSDMNREMAKAQVEDQKVASANKKVASSTKETQTTFKTAADAVANYQQRLNAAAKNKAMQAAMAKTNKALQQVKNNLNLTKFSPSKASYEIFNKIGLSARNANKDIKKVINTGKLWTQMSGSMGREVPDPFKKVKQSTATLKTDLAKIQAQIRGVASQKNTFDVSSPKKASRSYRIDGIQTDGIDRYEKQLAHIGDLVQKINRTGRQPLYANSEVAADRMRNSLVGAELATSRMILAGRMLKGAFTGTVSDLRNISKAANTSGVTLNKMGGSFSRIRQSAAAVGNNVKSAFSGFMKYNAQLKNIASGFRQAGSASSVIQGNLARIDAQLDALGAKTRTWATDMRRIVTGILISQGFYKLVNQMGQLVQGSKDFMFNMEQAGIAYKYILGDATMANKMLTAVQDFAIKSPLDTQGVINATRQLQALGFTAEATIPTMQVLADAASVFSSTGTDDFIQSTTVALGQMLASGKVMTQEVRQLYNAGIPALEILRDELGMTSEEVRNIGKAGIDSAQGVIAILNGLQKRYQGAAEEFTRTIPGAMEAITDSMYILISKVFGGLYDSIRKFVNLVSNALEALVHMVRAYGTGGLLQAVFPESSWSVVRTLIGSFGQLRQSLQFIFKTLGSVTSQFVFLGATISSIVLQPISTLLNFLSQLLYALVQTVPAVKYLAGALVTLFITTFVTKGFIMLFKALRMSTLFLYAARACWSLVQALLFLYVAAFKGSTGLSRFGGRLAIVVSALAVVASMSETVRAALMRLLAVLQTFFGKFKIPELNIGFDPKDIQVPEFQDPGGYEDLAGDLSDIGNEADNVGDGLDKAGNSAKKAAKKLKSFLQPFDEVYTLNKDDKDPLSGLGDGGLGDVAGNMKDIANSIGKIAGLGKGMDWTGDWAKDWDMLKDKFNLPDLTAETQKWVDKFWENFGRIFGKSGPAMAGTVIGAILGSLFAIKFLKPMAIKMAQQAADIIGPVTRSAFLKQFSKLFTKSLVIGAYVGELFSLIYDGFTKGNWDWGSIGSSVVGLIITGFAVAFKVPFPAFIILTAVAHWAGQIIKAFIDAIQEGDWLQVGTRLFQLITGALGFVFGPKLLSWIITKIGKLAIGKVIANLIGKSLVGSTIGAAFGGPVGALFGLLLGEFIHQLVYFPERTGKAIGEMIGTLTKMLTDAFGGMIKSIIDFFKNLKLPELDFSSFKAFFTSLVDFFKNADWAAIGKAIIDGFVNGIMSIGSAIANWAKTLATGFITGFKSAMGIQSPSTVMFGFGVNTLLGFLNGLLSMVGRVISFFTGLPGKIFSVFTAGITTGLTKVGTVFTGGIGKLGTLLTGAITRLGPVLLRGLTTLFSMMNPAVAIGMAVLGLAVLESETGLVSKVIDAVVQGITTFTTMLPTLIEKGVEIITTGITTLISSLTTVLPKIVDGIVNAIPALISAVTGIIPVLIPALINMIPTLLDGAITLFMALVQAIPQIIDALTAALPQIITAIVDGLIIAAPVIIQGVLQIVAAVIKALPQIIAALVKMIPAIAKALVKAFPKIVKAILKALGGMLKSMGTWVKKNVPGWVNDFVNKVKELPTKAVNAVKDLGKKIWEGINSGTKTLITNINNWVSDKVTKFKDGFAKVKDKVTGTAKKIWEGIKSKTKEFTDPQASWTADRIEAFKTGFNKVKDKVTGTAKNIWDGIKSKTSDFKTWQSNWVGDRNEAFKTNFAKVKSKVTGVAGHIWDGIKSKTSSFKTWVSDWVGDRITNFKTNFGKITSAGKSIVDGIWSGISSNTKAFLTAVKKWVGNRIKDIKEFFGINSPAKSMIPVGEGIVEGIEVGAEDETPHAVKTLGNMASDLIEGVQDAMPTISFADQFDTSMSSLTNVINSMTSQFTMLATILETIVLLMQTLSGFTLKGINLDDFDPSGVGNIATRENTSGVVRSDAEEQRRLAIMIADEIARRMIPALPSDDEGGTPQDILYVGNLIADSQGLKELERKLAVIRTTEKTRK